MNRKDLSSSGKTKNKASAADLRKKEKDCRAFATRTDAGEGEIRATDS